MIKKKFFFFLLLLGITLLLIPISYFYQPYKKRTFNETLKFAESYWVSEEWNKTWDSGNFDRANDIIIGNSDNLLITGCLDNGNDDDILIIKFNSSGNQLWNKTWGGNGDDYGYGIVEDIFGNIYVCGEKDWDGSGCGHLIVLKYDSNGNYIWNITLDDEPREKGIDIAIDKFNNLYIVGTRENDFFLIKFDSNGNQIWNRTWGFAGKLDYLEEIIIDSNNEIIIGRSYNYEYGITNWNTLITKFNSTGSQLWEDSIGGGGDLAYEFRDLTLDSNDNIYVCFLNRHSYAGFITYTPNGSIGREKSLNQEGEYVSDCYLHMDLNGFLYVFTTTDSASPWHTTLYKLNNSMKKEWRFSWIYNQTSYEYAREITGDSNNNLYIVISSETINRDIIIVKFTPLPPINPSISINNGDNVTNYNKVNLTLSVKGAKEMCFKNGSIGEWTEWEPYNTYKRIYLGGTKNNTEYFIFVKFRNQIGESKIVNDSIIYITNGESIPPEIIFEYSHFYITPFKPEYFHETLNITCFVYDLSPISWVYCCENSSGNFINQSMSKVNNENWTINIDISKLNWNDILSFCFYANDTWGNIGIENNFSMYYNIKIYDFQIPSSEIVFIPHSGTNIVNKSTRFSIIADDMEGSGIFQIKYSINNLNWCTYIESFSLSDLNPNTYTISFYSIDNAGNIEEIHSIVIKLIEIEEESPLNEPTPDVRSDEAPDKTVKISGYNITLILCFLIFFLLIVYIKKEK